MNVSSYSIPPRFGGASLQCIQPLDANLPLGPAIYQQVDAAGFHGSLPFKSGTTGINIAVRAGEKTAAK